MRSAIVVLITLSLAIAGCGKSAEQIEIEKQDAQLKQDLASKDRFIEEVTSTINDIHNKLESTWSLEKHIMPRNPTVEEGKYLSPADLRVKIMDRISNISSILSENRKKVAGLQHRLAEEKTQYTGLSQMVDDLKKSLDEREKTIATIQTQVMNLEGEVSSKTQVIAARDEVIENQTKQINTVYYAVGNRSELKDKKIIAGEGGILWGLLGTTTVLTKTIDEGEFNTLDKSKDMLIEVAGPIKEIVPERNPDSYTTEEKPDHHTLLKIIKPESFWIESHLAIVTD
jgi:hypothetical protein